MMDLDLGFAQSPDSGTFSSGDSDDNSSDVGHAAASPSHSGVVSALKAHMSDLRSGASILKIIACILAYAPDSCRVPLGALIEKLDLDDFVNFARVVFKEEGAPFWIPHGTTMLFSKVGEELSTRAHPDVTARVFRDKLKGKVPFSWLAPGSGQLVTRKTNDPPWECIKKELCMILEDHNLREHRRPETYKYTTEESYAAIFDCEAAASVSPDIDDGIHEALGVFNDPIDDFFGDAAAAMPPPLAVAEPEPDGARPNDPHLVFVHCLDNQEIITVPAGYLQESSPFILMRDVAAWALDDRQFDVSIFNVNVVRDGIQFGRGARITGRDLVHINGPIGSGHKEVCVLLKPEGSAESIPDFFRRPRPITPSHNQPRSPSNADVPRDSPDEARHSPDETDLTLEERPLHAARDALSSESDGQADRITDSFKSLSLNRRPEPQSETLKDEIVKEKEADPKPSSESAPAPPKTSALWGWCTATDDDGKPHHTLPTIREMGEKGSVQPLSIRWHCGKNKAHKGIEVSGDVPTDISEVMAATRSNSKVQGVCYECGQGAPVPVQAIAYFQCCGERRTGRRCKSTSHEDACIAVLPQLISAKNGQRCQIRGPIDDPCVLRFDPCGCEISIDAFRKSVKQRMEKGLGQGQFAVSPLTEHYAFTCPVLESPKCPKSFIHDIRHYKLAGGTVYEKLKAWGTEKAELLIQGDAVEEAAEGVSPQTAALPPMNPKESLKRDVENALQIAVCQVCPIVDCKHVGPPVSVRTKVTCSACKTNFCTFCNRPLATSAEYQGPVCEKSCPVGLKGASLGNGTTLSSKNKYEAIQDFCVLRAVRLLRGIYEGVGPKEFGFFYMREDKLFSNFAPTLNSKAEDFQDGNKPVPGVSLTVADVRAYKSTQMMP